MTSSDEHGQYVPIQRESVDIEPAHRRPFDISSLSVTGLVIMCELDDPSPENSGPSLSMKITQYLRLSDESMIRLDMDRGVSSSKFGHHGAVSWKRASADVISEVLTLVQADAATPGSFPWHAYANAARLRGIAVEAEALRDLPHTVLVSDQLATIYEF
ncbi:hypothetical protein [Cryobacterium sp. PAMC25264]|uniref:hypothetical protein n=1 Tax=Cryobacterium sp. PAMC25264 TaxID=2861288 RepID=UPI001C637C6E|nr:hypothetical protein [Cryobacterium sp. PAMC25264]QYF74442.1 hypothetical protein KY500_04365 [Cryobacterium sp. PAMC25264]